MDGDNRWDYRKLAFGPMIDEQQPTVIGVQEARPIQLSYLETAWPDYKWLGVGRRNDNSANDEFVPVFYRSSEVEPASGGRLNVPEANPSDAGLFFREDADNQMIDARNGTGALDKPRNRRRHPVRAAAAAPSPASGRERKRNIHFRLCRSGRSNGTTP